MHTHGIYLLSDHLYHRHATGANGNNKTKRLPLKSERCLDKTVNKREEVSVLNCMC